MSLKGFREESAKGSGRALSAKIVILNLKPQDNYKKTLQLFGGQTHNMYKIFIKLLYFSLTFIKVLFKSKEDLIFENMALRQQLVVYLTKREKPNIIDIDRLF
ncbi:MAG: hypothetical protein ACFFCW_31225 [Candidatus Hodarchaeota archaeon]